MKRILAALAGAVILATATPALAANSNPHPGWQHNPRNPHYVKPVPAHCLSWVLGAGIGDVPVCVLWS